MCNLERLVHPFEKPGRATMHRTFHTAHVSRQSINPYTYLGHDNIAVGSDGQGAVDSDGQGATDSDGQGASERQRTEESETAQIYKVPDMDTLCVLEERRQGRPARPCSSSAMCAAVPPIH